MLVQQCRCMQAEGGRYREVILRNAPQQHNSHESSGVICMAAGLPTFSQAAGTCHECALWVSRRCATVSRKVHFCLLRMKRKNAQIPGLHAWTCIGAAAGAARCATAGDKLLIDEANAGVVYLLCHSQEYTVDIKLSVSILM